MIASSWLRRWLDQQLQRRQQRRRPNCERSRRLFFEDDTWMISSWSRLYPAHCRLDLDFQGKAAHRWPALLEWRRRHRLDCPPVTHIFLEDGCCQEMAILRRRSCPLFLCCLLFAVCTCGCGLLKSESMALCPSRSNANVVRRGAENNFLARFWIQHRHSGFRVLLPFPIKERQNAKPHSLERQPKVIPLRRTPIFYHFISKACWERITLSPKI